MVKDFETLFKEKVEPTHDIDVAMFGFGMWKGNSRSMRNFPNLEQPVARLKSEWDYDTWIDSTMAKDPDDPEDFLYTLSGVKYPLYQIEKAVKFNRPSWVFFYLTGYALGEKFQGDLSEEEYIIVLKQTLEVLPDSLKPKLIEIEGAFRHVSEIM